MKVGIFEAAYLPSTPPLDSANNTPSIWFSDTSKNVHIELTGWK
jgi:hypothetical protein